MPSDHVQALNLAKEGRWDEAHRIVQENTDEHSCLIHGLLHRIEGDLGNARYWYRCADETMLENSIEEEIDRLYLLVTDK